MQKKNKFSFHFRVKVTSREAKRYEISEENTKGMIKNSLFSLMFIQKIIVPLQTILCTCYGK